MISKTEKPGKMSSRFLVDLENHLHAYKHGTEADLVASNNELLEEVSICQITFEFLIKQALQGNNSEIIHTVINSPALYYVKREFAEILKNSIDSKLKQQEKLESNNESSLLILDLHIEFDLENENIRIVISDNGMGFTEDKLSLFATKSLREMSNYYSHVGSDKIILTSHHDTKARRFLMGGAGKGIRELIGLADKGNANYGKGLSCHFIMESDNSDIMCDNAENLTFTVPPVSNLVFYNKTIGHGAVIDITTTKKPIVFDEIKAVETVKIILPERFTGRLKSSTSPNTVRKAFYGTLEMEVESEQNNTIKI